MTRDSDIDWLVVESSPGNTREESVKIRRALGDLGYPIDVLVMSTERFEETKYVFGGIAYPAHRVRARPLKPPEVALRELVVQWLEKADRDFRCGEHLLAGGSFREIIAFHCQQAAESN